MDQETSNYWAGGISGAASGAIAGTEISPGYGTLIGAVLGAGLGLYGAYETNQALENAPKYEIPDEIKKNLTDAEFYATQGMSEESKRLLVKGIQEQQAAQMAAGSNRRAGLVGLAASQQQQQSAYGQLAAQDALAREQHRKELMGQRNVMADYKQQKFQMDLNRYYENAAASQALLGSSIQNVYGAANADGSTKSKSNSQNNNNNSDSGLAPNLDSSEKNPNYWGDYSKSLEQFSLPNYNIQNYNNPGQ